MTELMFLVCASSVIATIVFWLAIKFMKEAIQAEKDRADEAEKLAKSNWDLFMEQSKFTDQTFDYIRALEIKIKTLEINSKP